MLRWLSRTIGIVLAGALAGAPGASAGKPAQPARIVAVGDLHGDFGAWREIASAAGLVDSAGRWIGGRATLVQVGDIVDREPESLKIVRELMRLQKDASRQGGRVVVLVGNHEAMNITGDLRYTTPGEFGAFATAKSGALRDRVYEAKKAEIEANYRSRDPSLTAAAVRDAWMKATPLGWVEQRLAWAPDGEIGRWVIGNSAAVLIGGNLFVHGGISAEYSKLSLAELNRQVASALASVDRSPSAITNSPLGPLWYRGLITRDPRITQIPAPAADAPARPSQEQELATLLAAYGARRIIVGHTPSRSGIQILFGGQLVDVDSANSRYYGGTPAYLEIIGDRMTAHSVRRSGVATRGGQE